MLLPTSRTEVFDTYWRFAAERLQIYNRRLADSVGPWTDDPILASFRFTNTYRAADRVSQYLIREVQYHKDRPQAPAEVFFRTILFKIFNRIGTWEALERELGPLSWQASDLAAVERVLNRLLNAGARIYSAAYIMPAPPFGFARKHANHVALLSKMMADGLAARLAAARSLEEVYRLIRTYPGVGPFLAFQYAIDLNYSSLLDFEESDFVVAGPGALDGIFKCFGAAGLENPEAVIHAMVERQDFEFARLGLSFEGLFGRPLMPIDCQNVFCEISKYSRAAHPDVLGASGRTRIKQRYRRSDQASAAAPMFPPRWKLMVPELAISRPVQFTFALP